MKTFAWRRVRVPSPAMVVALLALFVALAGSGTAAVLVTSADIRDGTIRGVDVRNGGLRGLDVANGSLRGVDVRNNSLTGADVNEASLGRVPAAERAVSAQSAGNANALDGLDSTAFLGAGAKATDSEALDGLDSTAFVGVGGKAADADALDGLDSTAFLGAGGKAADADALDGLDSAAFVQGNGRTFVRVVDVFTNPVAVSIPDIGTLTLACPASQAAVTVVMANVNSSFRESWASIDGGAATFAREGFFAGPHTVAQMPGSGAHRTTFALYREDVVAGPRPTFAALVNVWSAAEIGVCRYFVKVEASRPTT